MTEREQQIMELLRQDPMLPQGEIAARLGITRSSVSVHLANLSKKGIILGKGYVLAEEPAQGYVLGIGSANIDLMGRSREPLVMEDSNPGFISMSVGGVTHNICENAAHMGASVRMITAVGGDIYGEKIRRECEAAGIDTSAFLELKDEVSSTYLSLHNSDGEMALALSDMRVLQKLGVDYLETKKKLIRSARAIVMDTGLPQEIMEYVSRTYGGEVPVYADPVSTTYARKLTGDLHGYDTLKPNLMELEILAGMKITSDAQLEAACRRLLGRGLKRVVVSLGRRGSFYMDETGLELEAFGPAMENIVNATGAGDAFMGGMLACALKGLPPQESLLFATAASRMAISHRNTINPDITAEGLWALVRKDGLTVRPFSAENDAHPLLA